MFLNQFLAELSFKETHTETNTHRDTHKDSDEYSAERNYNNRLNVMHIIPGYPV